MCISSRFKKGVCLRSDTVYSRFWGRGGGSLAPTGARLGTELVPGWSRLFIKLDCVKGGPTMTAQDRSATLTTPQIKRANSSM